MGCYIRVQGLWGKEVHDMESRCLGVFFICMCVFFGHDMPGVVFSIPRPVFDEDERREAERA